MLWFREKEVRNELLTQGQSTGFWVGWYSTPKTCDLGHMVCPPKIMSAKWEYEWWAPHCVFPRADEIQLEEAWARESSLEGWMCHSGPRAYDWVASVGSCSSIPHFRWLVLQPGSQEGGWIACCRARTLIVLEPAMRKKSWGMLLYVNSRWGASFAFYIKRLSWVRWVRFPNTPKQYPSIWSTFKSFGWFSSDLVRIHSLVLQSIAATPPTTITPSALAKTVSKNARRERN